jgi:pimeloyl-ACP methyl ester carboxylesterase
MERWWKSSRKGVILITCYEYSVCLNRAYGQLYSTCFSLLHTLRRLFQLRGRYAEFLERKQQLVRQMQTKPKAERLHYFSGELRALQAYMRRDNLSNYARRLTCPTLVLHGNDDRRVPLAWSEELAELIPIAQKHIIAGGGHSLVHRSAQGRRVMIDFLQGAKQ